MIKRRTVHYQDEMLEQYRIKINSPTPPNLQLNFPGTLPDSDKIFSGSTKALSSDTDQSHHVNQAVYVRYCTDFASLAAAKGGVLKSFQKDLAYYNLKTFKIEYAGELVAGNDVEVLCWEDMASPHVLYFLVKRGDTICCRCVGEWHRNPDGTLTELTRSVLPEDLKEKL